jgi:hypothetical protein
MGRALKGETRLARSAQQLRAQLEAARGEVALSVEEVRRELSRKADWREWVRDNPAPFLVGAFAVGLWLGARRR